MSTLFPALREARYTSHARPFQNEYHCDGRKMHPDAKGSCGTVSSARSHAVRAIDHEYCTIVRIFNRATGQYVRTYKRSAAGITIHDGYVK